MDFTRTLISCLLILGCNLVFPEKTAAAESAIKGYYWRDYTGEIPSDALHGGYDTKEKTTYIGQAIYKGFECEAIPVIGQIRSTDKKMTFEWGYGEHEAERNIKILCTQQPKNFQWIDTNTTAIRNLENQNLILGGYEQEFLVYIGRASTTDNQLVVGKVLITPRKELEGLHTTVNGAYTHFTAFQVLGYKL